MLLLLYFYYVFCYIRHSFLPYNQSLTWIMFNIRTRKMRSKICTKVLRLRALTLIGIRGNDFAETYMRVYGHTFARASHTNSALQQNFLGYIVTCCTKYDTVVSVRNCNYSLAWKIGQNVYLVTYHFLRNTNCVMMETF